MLQQMISILLSDLLILLLILLFYKLLENREKCPSQIPKA